MKKLFNLIISIAIIYALYFAYDELFELYNHRTIVSVFLIIVILIILYFSMRKCWEKK